MDKWIGPYLIVNRLGKGGEGAVYQGVDPLLQRNVAIKVLSSDSKHAERIVHEARVVASLDHPNIVRLYHIDRLKDRPGWYVAMEFLEGGSLEQHLEQVGILEPSEAVAIAVQVASALACTHSKDLIHRDIKPGNILLYKDKKVKVADFGLSVYSKHRMSFGKNIGTPHYMAPEEWDKNNAPSARTDIYALGACLYLMLTGQTPFMERTLEDLAHAHLHKEVRSPRELNSSISKALDTLVMKCLEKSPEKRFQSAEVLHDTFEQLISLKLVNASDPSLLEESESSRSEDSSEELSYLSWFGLSKPPCNIFQELSLPLPLLKGVIQTERALLSRISFILLEGSIDAGRELLVPHLFRRMSIQSKAKLSYKVRSSPSQTFIDKMESILGIVEPSTSNQERIGDIVQKLKDVRFSPIRPSYLHFQIKEDLEQSELFLFAELCFQILEETENKLLVEMNAKGARFLWEEFIVRKKEALLSRVKMQSLDFEKLQEYVNSEWKRVGGSQLWISMDALLLLYHFSQGELLKVHRILHNSLFLASYAGKKIITTWSVWGGSLHSQYILSEEQLLSESREVPSSWPTDDFLQFFQSIKK